MAEEYLDQDARGDQTSWTAIQHGDVDYVVRRHWEPVYRFLRSRLPDAHEAEEATQEFFLRFIQRDLINRLDRERGSCRSFIFHLAWQFLVDRYRHRSSRYQVAQAGVGGESLEELGADQTSPAEEFDRQWFLSLLERARHAVKAVYQMRENPDGYRAFKLYYFGTPDGKRWTQASIAEALGLPVTQVNNYIHRARQLFGEALRQIVADYTGPEGVQEELDAVGRFMEDHRLQGPAPSTF